MTEHRIVCTTQEPLSKPHEQAHIRAVGVGQDPSSADRKMQLEEVLQALKNGDKFYTLVDGEKAYVHDYDCDTCGETTIRTNPDSSEANNLDSLRECNWRS